MENSKKKYLNANDKCVQKLRLKFKEIEQVLPTTDEAGAKMLKKNMKFLNEELVTYQKDFHELVDLIEEVGHHNSGLIGHFREDVIKIEETLLKHHLDTAEIDLLLLRRYEKDYLLRVDKKYIKKASDSLLVLRQD